MATQQIIPGNSVSFIAGSDLSGSQYCFVVKGSGANHVHLGGAGALAIGIVQNKPASGEEAAVAVGGESKIVMGAAAIAEGAQITSDASGKAVVATTGDQVLGVLTQSAAQNYIGAMVFQPAGTSA